MFKQLFTATTGLVVFAISPAIAATCGARDDLVDRLQSTYSETLTVGGLQKARSGHAVMEIWSSTETGTYTVLMSNPNGISCIVAAGTDFFLADPTPQVAGTQS